MSENAVVMQGVVKADGTLELDGKVPLPVGRVRVTVEPMTNAQKADDFLEFLRKIRERRERAGPPKRTGEEAQAALRQLRDDAAEEVAEIGRLQEEIRRRRAEAEKGRKEAE